MRSAAHHITAVSALLAVAAATLLAGCATPVVVRTGWGASADRDLPSCPAAYTDDFVSRGIWTVGDAALTVDTVVAKGPSPSCVLVGVPGTDQAGLDESLVLATYLDLRADEVDQAIAAIRDYAGSAGMTASPTRVADGITTLIFDGSDAGTAAGSQLVVSYATKLDAAAAEQLRVGTARSYVAVSALTYS